MTALLSVQHISKTFQKKFKALSDVSLDVTQGEFIALLGPSGCGKTTLLATLGGFLQPDTGKILIDGQEVTHLPPHKRTLNTVFQNYALFPHMTVLGNVSYGPLRAGLNKSEAHRQSREALDMVGLAHLADRYPAQMSGGQRQRIALARAIVNRPKLLLLDEPLSALDLKLRKRMQLELKALQEKLGISFVFVTHDQEEAMAMSDRIDLWRTSSVTRISWSARRGTASYAWRAAGMPSARPPPLLVKRWSPWCAPKTFCSTPAPPPTRSRLGSVTSSASGATPRYTWT
jgi:spermidine/putrescine transport system ATP-binding protein